MWCSSYRAQGDIGGGQWSWMPVKIHREKVGLALLFPGVGRKTSRGMFTSSQS